MSKKAEQRALEAYPDTYVRYSKIGDPEGVQSGISPFPNTHILERKCYVEGYEQAEKDFGWISVKDRLPDTTEYVFTCVKMNGIPQSVGFHYYKDGKWWEGYEEDSVGAVDYWMKIPKLKK